MLPTGVTVQTLIIMGPGVRQVSVNYRCNCTNTAFHGLRCETGEYYSADKATKLVENAITLSGLNLLQ